MVLFSEAKQTVVYLQLVISGMDRLKQMDLTLVYCHFGHKVLGDMTFTSVAVLTLNETLRLKGRKRPTDFFITVKQHHQSSSVVYLTM